jgi:hypothetical protein
MYVDDDTHNHNNRCDDVCVRLNNDQSERGESRPPLASAATDRVLRRGELLLY